MTATIEQTVEYPTVAMVIDEVHSRFGFDKDTYDDETVMNALDKWDAQFIDDPDWIMDEDEDIWNGTDIRDELRFEVEDALGLEF